MIQDIKRKSYMSRCYGIFENNIVVTQDKYLDLARNTTFNFFQSIVLFNVKQYKFENNKYQD